MNAVALLSLTLALTGPTDARPVAPPVFADVTFMPDAPSEGDGPTRRWRAAFASGADLQTGRPMVAFQYSDGYRTRLRIHKDASFAMLPLFGAEAIIGEKLVTNPNAQGLRTAHGALNIGILGLFALDSITGIWNLKEGWQDPNGRVRRLLHSVLMLTADVGFVATGLLAPNRRVIEAGGSPSTHRDVAVVSISVATVGYLIMIFR